MNPHILSALFKDALYQVLDNKVFRLLVILVIVMVLPTFLVAAREDSLVLFFGWREYFYADIFLAFGLAFPGAANANVMLIQTIQELIVDNLAGTFGIVFAIAATSFFLPRMIEKGAADTVFSKPVSRLALMLSRYVAGLIFVSILAVVLVGGMHVGLLWTSGYSDPGFLWSIVTLIYLFALLHAFSIAVGVFTRSSVAAILLSLMFFAFSGCVHHGWQAHEFFVDVIEPRSIAEGTKQESDDSPTVQAVASGLLATLDVLHYTLPKTTDASIIAERLRRQLEPPEAGFRDEDTGLHALVSLEGFRKVAPPAEAAPELVAAWRAPHPRGFDDAELTIKSYGWDDKRRRGAIEDLEERLKADQIEWTEDRVNVGEVRANYRGWTRTVEGATWRHKAYFFYGNRRLFVLELSGEEGWLDEHEEQTKVFLASITLEAEERNPFDYYASKTAWGGPLEYNLWFSLGSSLAFAVAMLALAWQRLIRIDF